MARGRSSIRTANESLQEQFLAKVRAVAEDPTLALPEPPEGGTETRAFTQLRRALTRAKGGRLPFTARFDKGILGAIRLARELAKQESAPRLLDARVDGNRRFFLQRGHGVRLVNLGVQNWEDPLALMLAYGPLATRDEAWLFAGSKLWSTGTTPKPPAQWFDDLAQRTGLALDDDGSCPHADRPRLALLFGEQTGARALVVCGPCGKRAGHLHGHLLQRVLCGADPVRPVGMEVRLPRGGPVPIAEPLRATYRKGAWDEAGLIDEAMKAWRGASNTGGARRFVTGTRDFGADQDSFLASLGLADWELAPARTLTAQGHVGESTNPADILGSHRAILVEALELLLPGEGREFASATGGDVRTILRLAHEEAQRRTLTSDLPKVAGLGPLGATLDGLVRDARVLPRHELLARLRVQTRSSVHRAHLYAFLQALGGDPNAERDFTSDQKEAGLHWASLAGDVLTAKGPEYVEALRMYLEQTGSGEAI